jgi:hypothetical protein
MTDEGPVLGPGWMYLASAIVLALGLYVGYQTLKVDRRVGAAIMTGGAIPAAVLIIQFTRLRRALGSAELVMLHELLPMGWSGMATYTRSLRGATLQSVEARLQCEECAAKGSGRSRREWRAIVFDQPIAPQTFPMMERIEVQLPLRIPAAGPPTLTYPDTEVIWWVRLRLRMEGCPNTRSSFRLEVAPAVVEL